MDASEEPPLYCARHSSTETLLHCGRCDTPICPRCMVQTPVGGRCPDCAQVRKPPMYIIGAQHYLRALAAASFVGVVAGYAWAQFLPGRMGIFFAAIIGLGLGWANAKASELATGRKRGGGMQLFAASGVVLAYAVRSALLGSPIGNSLDDLIVITVAVLVATTQLR
ncbi:MAG: hypothetical protein EXR43_01725 [Dehalococcoidia bacterium]|nr:hypothetical protein [Dehalococcoidia bacterium]